MAELTAHKCDQCGELTEDHYDFKGWITLRAEGGPSEYVKYSVEGGRNSNRCATNVVYYKFHRLDFCCFQHMVDFFKQLKKKKGA